MQNISLDYTENSTDHTFENNEYTAAAPLMHPSKSTFQPRDNILLICQKSSSTIKALKKNAKRQLEQIDELKDQLIKQLEQVDELKDQLNQLKQSLITPMPRHINRGRVHRSHPHPLVSSHSPSTIRPSISTYHHDDKLSFSSHPQKANI